MTRIAIALAVGIALAGGGRAQRLQQPLTIGNHVEVGHSVVLGGVAAGKWPATVSWYSHEE